MSCTYNAPDTLPILFNLIGYVRGSTVNTLDLADGFGDVKKRLSLLVQRRTF